MVGAGEGRAEGAVRREGRQRAGTRNLKHFDSKMPKFHVPALGEGEGEGREEEVREEVEEASERAGTRNLKHFYSSKLKFLVLAWDLPGICLALPQRCSPRKPNANSTKT